jgi:hypothetical protein
MAPNHMFIATNQMVLNQSITNVTNAHEIPLTQHPPKLVCPTKDGLVAMPPKLVGVNSEFLYGWQHSF